MKSEPWWGEGENQRFSEAPEMILIGSQGCNICATGMCYQAKGRTGALEMSERWVLPRKRSQATYQELGH